MKSKSIKVAIRSGRQQLAEFIETWKRAERGLRPLNPVDRLYFPDTIAMFRALSRGRLQLLSVLRRRGATSALTLARALGRDYKKMCEVVKTLKRFGLVHQGKGGVCVPFDRILMDAQIKLIA